jgi:hypothetical protein
MSKINIAEKKVNLDKLLFEIKIMECNYIIMNNETLNDLYERVDDLFTGLETLDYVAVVKKQLIATSTYASIWGIPIAICEKLKYGEVDLV